MTMQDKVKGIQARMAELQKACKRNDPKRHLYSLLYDAVLFTGPRLSELEDGSLVGFVELAAAVAGRPDADFRYVRNKLVELGFNTAPVN